MNKKNGNFFFFKSNIQENNLTFYIELDMKEWLRYKSFDIPILRSFELKLIKNITYGIETYDKYILKKKF